MATACVQHVVASSSAGVNFVDIPIAGVTAGSILVVGAADDFSATITGVSDGTAAFTQATSGQATQSSKRTDIWYLLAPTVGATNVRVTFSSSFAGLKIGHCWEFSGLSSPAFDAANTATSANAGSTTITGGSVTHAAADSVGVGVVYISFALSENPKSGTDYSGGGDTAAGGQYGGVSIVAASAAAHAPQWLDGISTAAFASSTAAFKSAAAATPQFRAMFDDRLRSRFLGRTRQSFIETAIAPEQFPITPSLGVGAVLPDGRLLRADARRLRESPAMFETIAPEQFATTLLWSATLPDGRLLRAGVRRLIEFPFASETIAPEQFDVTGQLGANAVYPDRPTRARRPAEYPQPMLVFVEPIATIPPTPPVFPDRPVRALRLREYPVAFQVDALEQFAATLGWGFSASADRPVRLKRLSEYPAAFWSSFTPTPNVAPDLSGAVLPDFPRRQRRLHTSQIPFAFFVRVTPPGSALKDFDYVGPVLPPWQARRLRTAIQQAMMAMGWPSGISDVPDHGFRSPYVANDFLTTPFAFDIIFVETEDGGEFLLRPYVR